jgi:hypothetical protein
VRQSWSVTNETVRIYRRRDREKPLFLGVFGYLEAARILNVAPSWLELMLAKRGSRTTAAYLVQRIQKSEDRLAMYPRRA